MEASEVDALAGLLSRTFIARRDVKAIQTDNGGYMPVTIDGKPDSERVPWKMGDLRNHVLGRQTFGHYLLSSTNTCKVFCYDLDLEKEIKEPDGDKRQPRWTIINPVTGDEMERTGNPREIWNPTHLWAWCGRCKRGWYMDYEESKCRCEEFEPHEDDQLGDGLQPDTLALTALLQETAFKLAAQVKKVLEIPVAVAYSGNKGVHVYGLVGEESSQDIRAAADIVIESFEGDYQSSRGTNFFRSVDPLYDPISIEVFPKQSALDGKDLGNLLRLPLGVNRKARYQDHGYFLKYGPYGVLTEADATKAITSGNPWDL
jgi:hypothetical protein